MVLPPSFSRKMGEIETVEAEKMGWLDLSRGTSNPVFPYIGIMTSLFDLKWPFRGSPMQICAEVINNSLIEHGSERFEQMC